MTTVIEIIICTFIGYLLLRAIITVIVFLIGIGIGIEDLIYRRKNKCR